LARAGRYRVDRIRHAVVVSGELHRARVVVVAPRVVVIVVVVGGALERVRRKPQLSENLHHVLSDRFLFV
jgi:hypothetical protein